MAIATSFQVSIRAAASQGGVLAEVVFTSANFGRGKVASEGPTAAPKSYVLADR